MPVQKKSGNLIYWMHHVSSLVHFENVLEYPTKRTAKIVYITIKYK